MRACNRNHVYLISLHTCVFIFYNMTLERRRIVSNLTSSQVTDIIYIYVIVYDPMTTVKKSYFNDSICVSQNI